MSINIPKEINFKSEISASRDTAYFSGEIDTVDSNKFLTPFFKKIINQMGESVTLDFSKLEFINSPGLKCIVSFILERNPSSIVTFIVDKTKNWQRKSLEVIQSLDEDKILITEV